MFCNLQSVKGGKMYKGLTGDLARRLVEHQKGQVSSTKSGRPWRLLYYEAFLVKEDAAREEKFLKSGKGKERLKYILRSVLARRGG